MSHLNLVKDEQKQNKNKISGKLKSIDGIRKTTDGRQLDRQKN